MQSAVAVKCDVGWDHGRFLSGFFPNALFHPSSLIHQRTLPCTNTISHTKVIMIFPHPPKNPSMYEYHLTYESDNDNVNDAHHDLVV